MREIGRKRKKEGGEGIEEKRRRSEEEVKKEVGENKSDEGKYGSGRKEKESKKF